MKKLFIVIMCLFVLIGCSTSKKPKDLEENLYNISIEFINIVDDYIDHISDKDNTMNDLSEFYDRNSYYFEKFSSDYNGPEINTHIYTYISVIFIYFIDAEITDAEINDILKFRNLLAELINMKQK